MNAAHSSSVEALQQVAGSLDRAERDYRDSQRYSAKAQAWARRDLAKAKQAYLTVARAPWIARLPELEAVDYQPGDEDLMARLRTAFAKCQQYRRTLPDTASIRQRIDAELEEERAEGLLNIVALRYVARLEKEQRAREKAAKRKIRK